MAVVAVIVFVVFRRRGGVPYSQIDTEMAPAEDATLPTYRDDDSNDGDASVSSPPPPYTDAVDGSDGESQASLAHEDSA